VFSTASAANREQEVDARSELYQCASTTKRDINGRCIGAEEKREAEPVELYQCASSKRDINGRCIGAEEKRSELYPYESGTKRDVEEREAEPAELYQCASTTKRDINGRCIGAVEKREPEPKPSMVVAHQLE